MTLSDNGLTYFIDKTLSTVSEPVFGSFSAINVNRFLTHARARTYTQTHTHTHNRSRIVVFHYRTTRIKHCLGALSLRKANSKIEIFINLGFYPVLIGRFLPTFRDNVLARC
jgi:hypothetical protein